ncbi:GNAT family N-acetyltransferase [Echinicola sediminis]
MKYKIDSIAPSEFLQVVEVWEASVRATHRFLKPGDIDHYKPLILNQYLLLVKLACVREDGGRILGFIGVAEKKVEMLFVHPKAFGRGIGKALMDYAVKELGACLVDVNEDNHEAVGFYKHLGFEVINRSWQDQQGNPYPILHMSLLK